MGCAGSSHQETNMIQGANGPLRSGVRVQTQWDEGRGHDNKWYCGTIEAVYTNGEAKIRYDDDDVWTGRAIYIYALPPHHPGIAQKVGIGAPTMDGIPGMGGASMAQMVGPPVVGMPPAGYGAPVGPPMMGGGGAQTMTVVATVPGGQTMQLQGPAGVMSVQVPPGVQVGQQFQFQTAGGPAPPTVMAQPVAMPPATVVMAQPVY